MDVVLPRSNTLGPEAEEENRRAPGWEARALLRLDSVAKAKAEVEVPVVMGLVLGDRSVACRCASVVGGNAATSVEGRIGGGRRGTVRGE